MNNPIAEKLTELARVYKTLPRKIAVAAVNFSKESFRQQGWQDGGLQKWKPRKMTTGRKSDNRAVLVKSGRLRRSIRATSVTDRQIVIGTDVPYAQIHNEGFTGEITQNVGTHTRKEHTRSGRKVQAATIRAYTRKRKLNMPKRQFMGPSETLNRQIGDSIRQTFDDVLNRS